VHLIVSYPKHEDMIKMRPVFEILFKRRAASSKEAVHPDPINLDMTN
jgi:hypothetical protein